MKKIFTDKKFNIFYSLFAIALMWAAWFTVAAAVRNEYMVASPAQSAAEFFKLFANGFFYRALGATLLRALCAFAVSFALALGCACLAAFFKPFAAFMRPVAALFRSMPTMAVLLLILVWLTPKTAPAAVAFLVLFPMIYSQLAESIAGVDKELLQMAEAYKLSARAKFFYIYLPHIAPLTVEQTGKNLSFSIKLIISAEVMASTYVALGGMISEAQLYINLPRLAALTVAAVLTGILIEVIFLLLAKLPYSRARAVRND